MSKTDRLYCTHCTFGTSALETHSADNADNVLGYSVRASSVDDADRGRLRQLFRTAERLLSYELPRDTPAGKKESLDAATAPRRLTFLPNLGDCQIVGQISYRARDTSRPPRPGSYFADILVGELGRPSAGRAGQRSQATEPRWSPAECLRLWSADHDGKAQGDWWCDSEERLAEQTEEGRGVPVAPSGGLADVRSGGAECISDAAFWSFLNTAPGGDFDDGGRIIPPRWQNMPVEDRQSLVANLLQATIDLLKNRGRGSVVVAVEPSVAALLFYGVCRLLPESLTVYSDQAAGISFSTYEPFPERPMTNLVATTFFDIQNPANDLPPDVYQRGFACNTFRQPFKCLKDGRELPRNDSYAHNTYAQHILRLATDGHTPARDHADEHELLLTLNGLTNLNVSMLDQLVAIDLSLAEYTRGVRPWAEVSRTAKLPSAGAEAEFLRKRFRTMVDAGARQGQAEWPPDLLQRAVEWLGDELVAEDGLWRRGHPESYRVLAGMLPTTEAALKEFISSKSARQPPDQVVVEALVSVAHRGHKLPDCLGEFLTQREPAGRTKGTPPFFQTIVERLDKHQLPEILLNSNPEIHADRILSAITRGGCGLPKPIVAGLLGKLLWKVLDDGVPTATRWRLLASHSTAINLLDRPISPDLQDRLSRHFSGSSPQSGLRNEPPAVTSFDGLQSLDFWAGLTTQVSENELLLKSWREFYKGFNKLKEKVKATQGKGFAWRGASKAIREDVAVVADSLCKIKGLRSCADMEKHHAAQCIGLFRSVLKAKETGVKPEESKQLEDLMQSQLDAHLATRAKSKSRSSAAASEARKGFGRWSIIAAGVAILIAGAAGTYVAVYGFFFSPSNGSKTVTSGQTPSRPKSPPIAKETEDSKKERVRAKAVTVETPETQQKRGPQVGKDAGLKLSVDNIKFKLGEIKDGKVAISWDPSITNKGTCTLAVKIPKENKDASDFEVNVDSAKQPQHVIDLSKYGYGHYSVTFKLTPPQGVPLVTPSTPIAFLSPQPPVVESLELIINPVTAASELVARIVGDDQQNEIYGRTTYKLRTNRAGTAGVGGGAINEVDATPKPIAGSAKVQELRFKMPSHLTPQDFLAPEGQRATFQMLMNTASGRGEPSEPKEAIVQVDDESREFMKRLLVSTTHLGVAGVCPLIPNQPPDRSGVVIVPLPPLITNETLDLVLLTPERADKSYRLSVSRDETAAEGVWKCLEQQVPNATRQLGELTQLGLVKSDAPFQFGSFRIDRTDPWKPLLRFTRDDTGQQSQDATVRMSYCKLGVVCPSPKPDAAPRVLAILQLLSPRQGGSQFSLAFDGHGKSDKIEINFEPFQNAPEERFSPPAEPSVNSGITASFLVKSGKSTLVLSMENEKLAEANVVSAIREGVLKVSQFKWATDASVGHIARADTVLTNKLDESVLSQFVFTKMTKEPSDLVMDDRKRLYDVLFNAQKKPNTYTIAELVDWTREAYRPYEEGDPKLKEARYFKACHETAQRLKQRHDFLGRFVKSVRQAQFVLGGWSIEWQVDAAALGKSDDDYKSVGGLIVKAIVRSNSEKTVVPPVAAPASDGPAAAK